MEERRYTVGEVSRITGVPKDTLLYYDKIVKQWPIGLGDTRGKCMCGVPCAFVNPSTFVKR